MTDLLGYLVLITALLIVTSLLFGFPIGRGKGIKVFGTSLGLSFFLFALSFTDFDSGALAFRNEDWPGAIQALERVGASSAHYDSAQALLAVARQKRASQLAADSQKLARVDTSGVPRVVADAGRPDSISASSTSKTARRQQGRTISARYSLSNDGGSVYISSSRDWWDDVHLLAVVPSGTKAVLLAEQRIEDVPGYAYARCRIRTADSRRVVGWVFCDDLH